MKSSIFKYIFILFIIAIIIFTIYTFYFKKDDTQNKIEETQQEQTEEVKELRLGISNYDTFNPFITNNKEVININKLVFEPLLSIGENYELEMCLATEWSKTSDTTYVIKIDNNKKWSDGSPVIAKDIQFTIDRLKEGNSIYAYNVEKVMSVEILDKDTVKITLSEPVPFFEYNLTFPLLPNNYYLGENFYDSPKIPIGTGMFKIDSIDGSNIVLSKNEKWWNIENKNSKIQKIQIKIYSEIGEVYNAFKLGNLDIFTTSNVNLEQYIGTIGYTNLEIKGRQFDYLSFNCDDDILSKPEVRKAIKYAIDRVNITSSIYNNQRYVSDFPLDYGNYLYQEETNGTGYNPEEAKKILQDNGWEYKYNRWQKVENYKTLRLNFNLTVNSSHEQRVAVAENIKAQLEQIGIKITLNKVSDVSYQKILQTKNYDIILTGIYNSYSPNLETFFGDNNIENYKNDEITSILQEVKNIKDENTLKEKYKRIIQIYNEEQPFISLYRDKAMIIKSRNLSGEVFGNNYYSYYRIETWKRN